MKILHRLLPYFLLMIFGIAVSCRDKRAEAAARHAVVDSAVAAVEAKLFRAKIDSVFKKSNFNGSATVFQNGKILYANENGFEDFNKKIKISLASVFAIGSLSKQFTAAMILLQQEKGKLNINDKVADFLPEFRDKAYENITVQQLLNHSSGLDDNSSQLKFKSGTGFNYSNKGYRSLGKIIEKVTGKTYDKNASELFQRAGMHHSYTSEHFTGSNFAGANVGNFHSRVPVENMPMRLSAPDISVSAGGILSTAGDLDIWNRALFGGKILTAKSLHMMTEKSSVRPHYVLGKVGYGYGIMMNLGAPKAYFHTGYVKGSPSLNVYYLDTKTSVIILSNLADESLGKEAFFAPHAEIKNNADLIENTTEQVRQQFSGGN